MTMIFRKQALYRTAAILLMLSLTFAATLRAATPAGNSFHIRSQWKLGGEGGWGYLAIDPAAQRLYIPRGARIMVVDTVTGKLIGTIEGSVNAIDIALDDSGRYGYVTDMTQGSAGFVRVFDRTTLKVTASIPIGLNPTAILFDPATRSVLALNSRDRSATIIDAATNQVTATIALAARPSGVVLDDKGTAFITLPAAGEIARIDLMQKKLTDPLPLAPCTGPSSLAIDRAHRQLFTTCDDHSLIAVDAETGRVTSLGQIAATTGDVGYDAHANLLFLADASGRLTIYRRTAPERLTRVQQLPTEPGARTMIVDPQTSRAFLVTAQYGQNNSPTVSEELRYRPTPIADSFTVLVVAR